MTDENSFALLEQAAASFRKLGAKGMAYAADIDKAASHFRAVVDAANTVLLANRYGSMNTRARHGLCDSLNLPRGSGGPAVHAAANARLLAEVVAASGGKAAR